ncbi:expressed unknown protein [Seminavis robusta]|uniref:Spore protein YkvP/CgeB glycosyl transferase-like domain-containing protein n=1 Tax=Seminavis robusta TaxID=568900 RepID=A0A9N8DPW5_9STRA|nr:expressed unknown protein [Seminavis robusta]|eukprot:Sro286_g108390.1 n/a (603) ;mRNA; f:62825-64633
MVGPSSPSTSPTNTTDNNNASTSSFRIKGIWFLGGLCVILQFSNIRTFRGPFSMVRESIHRLEDVQEKTADWSISRVMSESDIEDDDASTGTTDLQRGLESLRRKHAQLTVQQLQKEAQERKEATLKAPVGKATDAKKTSAKATQTEKAVPVEEASEDDKDEEEESEATTIPVPTKRVETNAWKEIVPTPVVFMPYSSYDNFDIKENLIESHDKNYFQDGLEESPFLRIANYSETVKLIQDNEPVSWIFDTSRLQPRKACLFLWKLMRGVQQQVWQTLPKSRSPTWRVSLSDTRDHGWEIYSCPDKMQDFLKNISKTVPYFKRGVVTDRSFDADTKKLDPGKLYGSIVNLPSYPGKDQPGPTIPSMPFYHSPINVRTDMVEALARILARDHDNMKLSSPIESLLRPRDVAHFYPPDLKAYRDEAPHLAKLRLTVSQTLLEFIKNEKPQGGIKRRYDIKVGLVGASRERGRKTPQKAYIKELLRTKIVVVAQRDTWEDHWRLFEAMISGAMIMTDTILGMPTGLKHAESIVVFDSLESLKAQLKYYLDPANEAERIDIATKGRFIAMSQHRSWHRMEEMALGEVKSTCAVSRFPECPYTVHAA